MGFPRGAFVIVQRDHGGQARQVVLRNHRGGHAQFLVHCDVALQTSLVHLVDHHQVAGLHKPGSSTHPRVEVGEYLEALPGELRCDPVGVMHAADGLGAASAAGTEHVALQQNGIRDPQLRQVKLDGATDDAAANDYRVGHVGEAVTGQCLSTT